MKKIAANPTKTDVATKMATLGPDMQLFDRALMMLLVVVLSF